MQQVLFRIPVKDIADSLPDIPVFIGPLVLVLAIALGRWRHFPKLFFAISYVVVALLLLPSVLKWISFTDSIPIYGYGAMLFVAFVSCVLLAARLGLREGIDPRHIQDLAIWIFIFGIIGGRITFMIQDRNEDFSLGKFVKIWEGGLVFYGGAIGGAVGYFVAYFVSLRKYHISSWKMADVIAPCAALGLALGRVGCLLNGCCYGNVACADCPAVGFPLSAPPRYEMTRRGYQTDAGFTLDAKRPRTVGAVEPDSAADRAGLHPDDVILQVNDKEVATNRDIDDYLHGKYWPRGKNDLLLLIHPSDPQEKEKEILFSPTTIGLHPTQVYESVSMVLLAFLLLAYYPFKRHDGSLMVIFMLAYSVHRFLNEMLRTDTDPVSIFGIQTHMTLSQNISILVLIAGILLGIVVWTRPQPKGPECPAMAEGT